MLGQWPFIGVAGVWVGAGAGALCVGAGMLCAGAGALGVAGVEPVVAAEAPATAAAPPTASVPETIAALSSLELGMGGVSSGGCGRNGTGWCCESLSAAKLSARSTSL
jgi:hypothetical protein